MLGNASAVLERLHLQVSAEFDFDLESYADLKNVGVTYTDGQRHLHQATTAHGTWGELREHLLTILILDDPVSMEMYFEADMGVSERAIRVTEVRRALDL